MATALAAQLAQIRAKSSNPLDLKAQKKAHSKSLIFEPQDAANQDFDTIYQLCYEGFLELRQLDPRFAPFGRSLFSEQSKQEDRTQMTEAQNEQLDAVVEDFLGLVGSRLLLKPALRTVEWLVRRFRVHEHNTICFVMSFLPYHTHPMFPTVLAILPQSIPPTLKFLFPYIQTLGNPSRHTVVYTATNNQAFFTALNSYVFRVCRLGFQYGALLSFWASVVAEATAGMIESARSGRQEAQKQHQENVIMRIIPILNDGFSVDGVPELRIGCYMIVTVLASKAVLSDEALTALMDAVTLDWVGTTHAGLICLAVLAQKRGIAKLPHQTFKALMSIDNLEDDLKILKSQYRVDTFVLGIVLGIVARLQKEPSVSLVARLRALMIGDLMDGASITAVVASMLRVLGKAKRNPSIDLDGPLSNLIVCLAAADTFGGTVKAAVMSSDEAPKTLQQRLQNLSIGHTTQLVEEDQEMPDVDQLQAVESFDDAVKGFQPRTAQQISFLSRLDSCDFSSLMHLFVLAIDAPETIERFLHLPILKESLAMTEPLFMSFFIRAWGGPFPVRARVAAINVITNQLAGESLISDLQILFPYIIYSLADPVVQVRRSSSKLVLLLAKAYRAAAETSGEQPKLQILGHDRIYGETKETTGLSWLSFEEGLKLLEDFLVPNLEESLLDAGHVARQFSSVMNGTIHANSTKSAQKNFRSSWKHSIFAFFCSHVTQTPLRCVKSRLLNMLNRVPKAGGVLRTKTLLPLLTSCTDESEDVFLEKCSEEQVQPGQYIKQLVEIVSPTDREGVHFLRDNIEPRIMLEHPLFYSAVLDHVGAIWSLTKHDIQAALAEQLLESAISSASAGSEVAQVMDALDVLRKVKLSSSVLLGFLKNLPPLTPSSVDEPSTTKRRKTSHGHETARMDLGASDNALRRLTIVLELIDASEPERHPELLKSLFDILADLESYKRHSGTELGYLEIITLNSAYGIVRKVEITTGSQIDPSAIKADVLIGCISTTENPQVQQAALLLVASIASVAPELILHSVMPIFTYMGAGLMRNSDEYSVHVVKKTMESVIPRLVQSLHKRKGHPVVSVSELLLSFVAAYKDIPQLRRQELFLSLTDKIGADEFLFALIMLLIDKYPSRKSVLDFAAGLVERQKITTQLITIEKYLDTALDLFRQKPSLSTNLLSNEALRLVDEKVINILPLLSNILDENRLKVRTAKSLFHGGEEASMVRSLFARVLEQILSLREKTSRNTQVTGLCDVVLRAFLNLLSLEAFIQTLPELLERTHAQLRVHVLQSLEVRLQSSKNEPPPARKACIAFLPQLTKFIQDSTDEPLRRVAVICTDQIVEMFGRKDVDAVSAAATTIGGCLATVENSVVVAALLCLATMAEVLGEALIPTIPQSLPITMDHLAASLDEDAEDPRLHNACYAFVTSLLLYLPLVVTGTYLDRFLKVSYESANAEMGDECNNIRTEALRLVARSLEPKDCFAALDRTWTNAMAEGPLAVKEYLGVLRLAIESRPKSAIAKQSDALANLFLKVFDLRRIQFSPRTDDSYEDDEVEEVEVAANDTIIAMIYKINDTVFRPIFTRFLEWSTSPTLKKDLKSKLYRQTTMWTFLLNFFGTLKSIVTSYAGLITEDATDILKNISLKDADSRLLWERVILTLQSAFEHDQDDFFQSPTHFPPLCAALIAQLPAISTSPHSTTLLPQLITAMTLLATTTDAPAQQKSLCGPLLQYMRDDSAAVRLAAVKTQRSLTERLGEEWLAQLPEMLPFISEGMEDDDEGVELEFRRWVKRIEEILGESIAPMLQ